MPQTKYQAILKEQYFKVIYTQSTQYLYMVILYAPWHSTARKPTLGICH